jgi:type II secretory pathway component PulJ
MRRGLTLLELVLALALLVGIAVTATSWTTTSARAADRLGEESAWSLATDATLGLIGEAVASGDPIHDVERVRVNDDAIMLRTRDSRGPATLTIERRDDLLVLVRKAESQSRGEESTLLDRVAAFEPSLEHTDDDRLVLSLKLTRLDGAVLTRRWVVR